MRKLFLLLCLLGAVFSVSAQNGKVTVSGIVWDADLNEAMGQATVQLLAAKDSAFVNGCVTQMNGQFQLPAVKAGNYVLKVSFIGYLSQFKSIQLTARQPKYNVGKISLSADAIMMQEAVVVGHVPPVQMSEDTVVFNSAAYKVAEGSALEELVKKLPGAEVSEDGSITINGKSVSKILIDGKEFFGSDMDMAMKNIPVDMVEKLKTYERQSDLARITGIDDGEEETVIDLSVKDDMKHGWLTNSDIAGGTESRYSAKTMVSRYTEKQNITFMGGLNNVNDRGITSRRGSRGLRTQKHAGLNISTETEKFEVEGNARFRYNKNDSQTKNSSETFLDQQSSFENSLSSSLSTGNDFNADFKLEWRPDTLTTIIARPRFSYGTDDGSSNNTSATFDDDPYRDGITDPLEQMNDDILSDILVNSNRRISTDNSNSTDANLSLMVNRRLGSSGRNITVRGSAGYTDGESESISLSRIQYYLNTGGAEAAQEAINRYSRTPTRNWNYSAEATYSEPIFKGGYLQFRYNFQYKYSKSDRSTYDIGGIPFDSFELPAGFDDPDNLTLDEDQSRFAEYHNYIHTASLSLRVTREKLRLNAGINFVPQRSELNYKYQGIDTAVVRNVSNFTPSIRCRRRLRPAEHHPRQSGTEALVPAQCQFRIPHLRPGNAAQHLRTTRIHKHDELRRLADDLQLGDRRAHHHAPEHQRHMERQSHAGFHHSPEEPEVLHQHVDRRRLRQPAVIPPAKQRDDEKHHQDPLAQRRRALQLPLRLVRLHTQRLHLLQERGQQAAIEQQHEHLRLLLRRRGHRALPVEHGAEHQHQQQQPTGLQQREHEHRRAYLERTVVPKLPQGQRRHHLLPGV